MTTKPIYLDNNATTAVDPEVVEVMLPVFSEHYGNPASKTHSFGWYAEELVQIAREQVAELIGAGVEEIIFTSGATEANNLALKGSSAWRQKKTGIKGEIISFATEHRSILDPLSELEEEGFQLNILGVDSKGHFSKQEIETLVTPNSFLLSAMLANNEIGTIHDISLLSSLTKKHGTILHCDATQALGKIAVNVTALGVDSMSFSSHKIYGPKGVGALFVKKARQFSLLPLFSGGGHEHGLRSGTLNVPGIVGFGKACEIAKKRLEHDRAHLESLSMQMLEGLKSNVSGVSLNGPEKPRLPGNLNVAFSGVEAAALIGEVSSKLAISSSSACTSASTKSSFVLNALGFDEQRKRSSIRIGIGRFTTANEVDCAIEVLRTAIDKLRQ